MADEATLPTEEEIAQLPRWARVAFAARCAARVLPLLPDNESDEVWQQFAWLLDAVEFAKSSAFGISGLDDWTAHYEKAQILQRKAAELVRLHDHSPVASTVAECVWSALDSMGVRKERSAQAAFKSARLCFELCLPYTDVRRYLRNDYQSLHLLTGPDNWSGEVDVFADTAPIPLTTFGPLWPDGLPSGWPQFDEANALDVTLFAPERTSPHVIGESLVKLWEAANEYHMAGGGGVLTFDEFKQMVPSLVPVGPQSEG
jgi:hypothetical protein